MLDACICSLPFTPSPVLIHPLQIHIRLTATNTTIGIQHPHPHPPPDPHPTYSHKQERPGGVEKHALNKSFRFLEWTLEQKGGKCAGDPGTHRNGVMRHLPSGIEALFYYFHYFRLTWLRRFVSWWTSTDLLAPGKRTRPNMTKSVQDTRMASRKRNDRIWKRNKNQARQAPRTNLAVTQLPGNHPCRAMWPALWPAKTRR